MKTIKEMALTTCENFQREYPSGKPIYEQMLELEKTIRDFTYLKCKETAKNVRHKAIEVLNEESLPYRNGQKTSIGDFAETLERKIMNIQFDDVEPEFDNIKTK